MIVLYIAAPFPGDYGAYLLNSCSDRGYFTITGIWNRVFIVAGYCSHIQTSREVPAVVKELLPALSETVADYSTVSDALVASQTRPRDTDQPGDPDVSVTDMQESASTPPVQSIYRQA